jgi:hypothetical protein
VSRQGMTTTIKRNNNRLMKLGALLALGAGLATAQNAFAATDTFSITPGSTSGLNWYNQGYGPNFGSISPTTTSDGNTIDAVFFYADTWSGYYSVNLRVIFTGTAPATSWLNSLDSLPLSGAVSSCASNVCSWTWQYQSINFSGPTTFTINHN